MYSNFIVNIKETKTGEKIPVINDIHIHSAYNPIREAENFASQKEEAIAKNPNVLIFGLGFGYHIDAIAKILSENHKNFTLKIIEPVGNIVDEFHNLGFKLPDGNIDLYSFDSVEEFYECEELMEFMVLKPLVIPHPSSFKLCQDFFKAFMSHSASTKMKDIISLLKDDQLITYLGKQQNDDFNRYLMELEKVEKITSPEDLFFMTYKELVTTNSTGEINE